MTPEQLQEFIPPFIKFCGILLSAFALLIIQGKLAIRAKRKLGMDNYTISPLGENVHVMIPNATGATEWVCGGLNETGRYIKYTEVGTGNTKLSPIIGFETKSFVIKGAIKEQTKK